MKPPIRLVDDDTPRKEHDNGGPTAPQVSHTLVGGLIVGVVTFFFLMLGFVVIQRWDSGVLNFIYMFIATVINLISWGPFFETGNKVKGKVDEKI